MPPPDYFKKLNERLLENNHQLLVDYNLEFINCNYNLLLKFTIITFCTCLVFCTFLTTNINLCLQMARQVKTFPRIIVFIDFTNYLYIYRRWFLFVIFFSYLIVINSIRLLFWTRLGCFFSLFTHPCFCLFR